MQIEKGELLPLFERHDLAVENDFVFEGARLVGQFGELVRHPAEVA